MHCPEDSTQIHNTKDQTFVLRPASSVGTRSGRHTWARNLRALWAPPGGAQQAVRRLVRLDAANIIVKQPPAFRQAIPVRGGAGLSEALASAAVGARRRLWPLNCWCA
eukprot:366231-Chlamydomonas_euryale.AAC.3